MRYSKSWWDDNRMIPDKLKAKIELYAEIYTKCYALDLIINQPNARWVANEMFRETAKDMRSELISRLHNGLQDKYMEVIDDKTIGTPLADAMEPKKENVKPATDKQKYTLHKFGIERIPENLGIKEAGEILNILISHSKEGEHEAIANLIEKFNKEWA
jgi:5'-deoxynucleotidase YfbR-like HD superfamily hydrolase